MNALRWRHNDHAGVSNHQPHECLLNRLFRRKSKKTSKLRVTGLCAGNSPGTGEFPAQMASYAENVSIWWRHHVKEWRITVKSIKSMQHATRFVLCRPLYLCMNLQGEIWIPHFRPPPCWREMHQYADFLLPWETCSGFWRILSMEHCDETIFNDYWTC